MAVNNDHFRLAGFFIMLGLMGCLNVRMACLSLMIYSEDFGPTVIFWDESERCVNGQ